MQFGIISAKIISGKAKIAIYIGLEMIIWTFGADPTPLTTTIIMVPFAVIFEVALFVPRRIERNRPKAATDISPSLRSRLSAVRCKFCSGTLGSDSSFCPVCGKSQA